MFCHIFSGFPFFFRWCMGLKIHRFHGKFLPNDSSTVTAEEERFARQFLRAASLAGFTPLSRFDLDRWYRWGSGRIETPKLDGLRLEMTCLLIFIDVYWCLLMFIFGHWLFLCGIPSTRPVKHRDETMRRRRESWRQIFCCVLSRKVFTFIFKETLL